MKSLKPIRKLKDNCWYSDVSSLALGYYKCRIAAVNGLFTNAAWSENWCCKQQVPCSPSHFSGLVKFFRTDAKSSQNSGANIFLNDATTLTLIMPQDPLGEPKRNYLIIFDRGSLETTDKRFCRLFLYTIIPKLESEILLFLHGVVPAPDENLISVFTC